MKVCLVASELVDNRISHFTSLKPAADRQLVLEFLLDVLLFTTSSGGGTVVERAAAAVAASAAAAAAGQPPPSFTASTGAGAPPGLSADAVARVTRGGKALFPGRFIHFSCLVLVLSCLSFLSFSSLCFPPPFFRSLFSPSLVFFQLCFIFSLMNGMVGMCSRCWGCT